MAMKPVRVSQLNNYIKRVLQSDPMLGNVSVIGEISNLKYHSTGVYFSLKDPDSRISCYIPPSVSGRLRYDLDEGLEIVAYGYINLYEKGGSYSINIRDIDVQGTGNLAIAFEKLKQKLQQEGLFDEKYKKPIPAFPERVAVITSPTGAAVNDIKKIITTKNNYVDILIYPVLVQGTGAAPDIAEAIRAVNAMVPPPDVIITGRGGGSIEELWAFNEEIVARAIFESEIPVISAVGHETDFTIADFVADRRAETPTAAADMAVPDTAELMELCTDLKEALCEELRRCVDRREAALEYMNLDNLRQRLEDRIALAGLRADGFLESCMNSVNSFMTVRENLLNKYVEALEALNPQNIINRGFAVVTGEDGKLISSVTQLAEEQTIHTRLKDGCITSHVTEIRR